MKINGNGSNLPLENAKASKAKDDIQVEGGAQSKGGAKVIDSVDARLSRALKAVEDGIFSSGLTASEVHSHLDENRIVHLLKSIENVEAKGPSLGNDAILALVDRVNSQIEKNPSQAFNAHERIDGARVIELTDAF